MYLSYILGGITINRKRLYVTLAAAIFAGSFSIYSTKALPTTSAVHNTLTSKLDSKLNYENFMVYKDEIQPAEETIAVNNSKIIILASNTPNTPVQQTSTETDNKLKSGTTNDDVKQLQTKLQKLGFFTGEITGFYGDVTAAAIQNFQKSHGLTITGEADKETLAKLDDFISKPIYVASRGETDRSQEQAKSASAPAPAAPAAKAVQKAVSAQPAAKGGVALMNWFGGVENVFSIGSVATVTDLNTGLAFKVKRTYGYNHSDTETLTAADTEVMKRAIGGSWNWVRRPVIVEVNGQKIAGSMAPFPHAGRDDKPANITVSNRSGDYGTGDNLDAIKGNNMDGHFDIHFLGSKTHGSNKVDPDHQAAVKRAYEIGK